MPVSVHLSPASANIWFIVSTDSEYVRFISRDREEDCLCIAFEASRRNPSNDDFNGTP
jgi:hypothetical protein